MSNILLLLAEDEPVISLELEQSLKESGYECIIVQTGQKALDELDQDAARFKGVLTDIRLGNGPDGWDVGRRARELVHDMPVIYVSGDSTGSWSSKGVPNSIMISKPYASAQIITAISQLINTAATAKAGLPSAPA